MSFSFSLSSQPHHPKPRLKAGLKGNLGDHGVRKYDSEIGRFLAIDPQSDKFFEWNPYQYSRNNPIKQSDIDGMADYIFNMEGKQIAVQNDWGALESFNVDRYYVRSGNNNLRANAKETITQMNENGKANGIESNPQVIQSKLNQAIRTVNDRFSQGLNFKIYVVGKESMDRKLFDFKNKLENKLYLVNGILYNKNEFGNYQWGYAMHHLGYSRQASVFFANFGTLAKESGKWFNYMNYFSEEYAEPRLDETNEIKAIKDGWENY